jgi:hypothetical protein
MAVSRKVRHLLCIFSVVTCSFAQDAQQLSRRLGISAPEKVSLGEVSTVQVPSLPPESIGAPLLCDPDGRILFRMAMPGATEDQVSVSADGKTVIRFNKEKVNDIPQPRLGSTFLSGSDVYILTWGRTPLGYETKWRTPTGEVLTSPASKISHFVAHFGNDGRYTGSVPLDVPFQPQQLGVFGNGDSLIAGAEPSTGEPRLAIVAPNGQLRRMIELKGDVHAQEESNGLAKEQEKDPTALPRYIPSDSQITPSLFNIVSGSQIAKDGSNLLLFRPMNGPVFSVSPSGEVRVHKLKVEGDFSMHMIKATPNAWIVEFLHNAPFSEPMQISTYAFDPETGSLLREYLFPDDLASGLACTDGNEFTFVMADTEKKTLNLVKLAATAKQN